MANAWRIRLLAAACIAAALALTALNSPAQNAAAQIGAPAANANEPAPGELIYNGNLAMPDGLSGWSAVNDGGDGTVELELSNPRGDGSPASLKLASAKLGRRAGAVNTGGPAGIKLTNAQWYDVTFWARTEGNRHVGLVFSLESPDGKKIAARSTLPEVGGGWRKYELSLQPRNDDARARLVISQIEPGTIWLSGVSLLPRTTPLAAPPAVTPAASPSAATAPAQNARAGRGRADLPAAPIDPRMAQLGSRGVGVHDPSTIVESNGQYWTFYTGRGVGSWHSSDLTNWTAGPRIFNAPLPWVSQVVPLNRNMDCWAPDVFHLGGKYLLYYSLSSFGKNTSAIGLVTNTTLDPADPAYQWQDQGVVIQSGLHDDFNTIDPAVAQDTDGRLFLTFGSFWSGIRMIELSPTTGKRIAPDSPVYLLAHYDSIEASYIYHHGNFYYLFVNWGMCCRGANSTYHMRIGRSDKITGPYLDKDGVDMRDDGGTMLLGTDGQFIGPGHAGIVTKDAKEWLSMHFYDGTRRGQSQLAIRPITWDASGWPVVGDLAQQ